MQSVEKDVNVNVVILKNSSQVLLVKNIARWKEFSSTGKKFFKPSKWGMPNGKKEPGENETETAVREAGEKTGFLVEIEPSIRIEYDAGDHLNVTFLGRIVGGEMKIPLEEIIDCKWFFIHSLPLMYSSHWRRLRQLLEELQKGQRK